VWFQRATDVVRKLATGDVDLGIVGFDMLSELGDGNDGAWRGGKAGAAGAPGG
jgi:ATP phosphoribosyltransferase